MPPVLTRAMDEICLATREQGSRLWLDAEQQVLQHGLDDWAIEIMKKHNKSGPPLVYNTIQAYLKGSKTNLDRHLTLASEGGFGVGVKLVRGAYIEHEMRSLIHDTKEETDQSYDLLADAMIGCRMPEGSQLDFPDELAQGCDHLPVRPHVPKSPIRRGFELDREVAQLGIAERSARPGEFV